MRNVHGTNDARAAEVEELRKAAAEQRKARAKAKAAADKQKAEKQKVGTERRAQKADALKEKAADRPSGDARPWLEGSASGSKRATQAGVVATRAWIDEVLETMNDLRACHGAKPIEWDESFFDEAKKEAEEYAITEEPKGRGPSGHMFSYHKGTFQLGGLASSWFPNDEEEVKRKKQSWSVKHAIRWWYSHGQMWLQANRVGVALSKNGSTIVASYGDWRDAPKQAGCDGGARRAIAKLEKKMEASGEVFYGMTCPMTGQRARQAWENLLEAKLVKSGPGTQCDRPNPGNQAIYIAQC